MVKDRQSNIELLRIVSIIGVIILHYNNSNIGGGMQYVKENSINFYILNILEAICIISVDTFMIISGFFLIKNTKRNLWKPIELLFQVVFFSLSRYIIINCILKNNFSIKGLLVSCIPANYFIILYICVFIVSPFINIIINNLNDKNLKKFIIILMLLFSIYPTAIDLFSEICKHQFIGLSSIGMYGSQWGYSITNFMLCYIIGAWLFKSKNTFLNLKNSKLILIFIINTIIITIWSIMNNYIGYFTEKSSLEYCNPFVICNAGIIFVIFYKINIKNVIINKLSQATFTVFLCHDIFLKKILINKFVNYNLIFMILHIIISSICIYMICFAINYIYIYIC